MRGNAFAVRSLALSIGLAIAIVGCGRAPDATRTDSEPSASNAPIESVMQCIPIPKPSPLPWPPGATVPEGTRTPLNGADWPPTFDMEGALRDHFGERFSMMWMTSFRKPDQSDQRLIVGLVAPTAEDRDHVATLPVRGGRVDVVATTFSEAQLQGYKSVLTPMIDGADGESSMWGIGLGLRDANASAVGQPAVIVYVTACDPELMHRIASLVPADAVQAWASSPAIVREGSMRPTG
jgi:hypothetical protein